LKPIETVAIIGAGALGSVYGSLLAPAMPGRVSFIASGARLERLAREGVVVNGRRFDIPAVDAGRAKPADLLVVAVKHHHLDRAIEDMRQAVGPRTTVLSVMNGIDSEERIGAVYGMGRVLYGLTLGIDALREGNAVTYTTQGKIFFGEAKNPVPTDRVRRVKDVLDRAGIACEVPGDMIRALWKKFMINVGVNQVSAVLRAPYGMFRTSPEARDLSESAMREVIRLARAQDIDLGERDIEDWYRVLERLGAGGKTSMLQDVEAGRKTEVEMLAGTVIELGRRRGVDTPVNRALYERIKAMEPGAPPPKEEQP